MSADACCMMRIFKFTLNAKKQMTENRQSEICSIDTVMSVYLTIPLLQLLVIFLFSFIRLNVYSQSLSFKYSDVKAAHVLYISANFEWMD